MSLSWGHDNREDRQQRIGSRTPTMRNRDMTPQRGPAPEDRSSSQARGVSSNAFACGGAQNTGNMLTDRRTTRVTAPPGGASSFSLGWGDDAANQQRNATPRRAPNQRQADDRSCANAGRHGYCDNFTERESSVPDRSAVEFGARQRPSSNSFASGRQPNTGNVLTDRPTSRVTAPPGGVSTICLGTDQASRTPRNGAATPRSRCATPARQSEVSMAHCREPGVVDDGRSDVGFGSRRVDPVMSDAGFDCRSNACNQQRWAAGRDDCSEVSRTPRNMATTPKMRTRPGAEMTNGCDRADRGDARSTCDWQSEAGFDPSCASRSRAPSQASRAPRQQAWDDGRSAASHYHRGADDFRSESDFNANYASRPAQHMRSTPQLQNRGTRYDAPYGSEAGYEASEAACTPRVAPCTPRMQTRTPPGATTPRMSRTSPGEVTTPRMEQRMPRNMSIADGEHELRSDSQWEVESRAEGRSVAGAPSDLGWHNSDPQAALSTLKARMCKTPTRAAASRGELQPQAERALSQPQIGARRDPRGEVEGSRPRRLKSSTRVNNPPGGASTFSPDWDPEVEVRQQGRKFVSGSSGAGNNRDPGAIEANRYFQDRKTQVGKQPVSQARTLPTKKAVDSHRYHLSGQELTSHTPGKGTNDIAVTHKSQKKALLAWEEDHGMRRASQSTCADSVEAAAQQNLLYNRLDLDDNRSCVGRGYDEFSELPLGADWSTYARGFSDCGSSAC